jgi:hypothetical protein
MSELPNASAQAPTATWLTRRSAARLLGEALCVALSITLMDHFTDHTAVSPRKIMIPFLSYCILGIMISLFRFHRSKKCSTTV